MCTYCMMGDWHFRRDPPWDIGRDWPRHPLVPSPLLPHVPIVPWQLDRVREFEDLIRRVKELEDKLGCPCEPNKADYLALLRERIAILEAAEKSSQRSDRSE